MKASVRALLWIVAETLHKVYHKLFRKKDDPGDGLK